MSQHHHAIVSPLLNQGSTVISMLHRPYGVNELRNIDRPEEKPRGSSRLQDKSRHEPCQTFRHEPCQSLMMNAGTGSYSFSCRYRQRFRKIVPRRSRTSRRSHQVIPKCPSLSHRVARYATPIDETVRRPTARLVAPEPTRPIAIHQIAMP